MSIQYVESDSGFENYNNSATLTVEDNITALGHLADQIQKTIRVTSNNTSSVHNCDKLIAEYLRLK